MAIKLIVGLGNPSKEYENTKHNVGFKTIDLICNKLQIKLDQSDFNGIYTKIKINNEEVIIAKPLTYMNLSGEFVSALTRFYKIDFNDILVISDDIDTKLGVLKIKPKGSSGGQNGLANIFNHLHTENIKRIKIGIGRPINKQIDVKDYVLSKFTKEEQEQIDKSIEKSCQIAVEFPILNFDKLMSKFN